MVFLCNQFFFTVNLNIQLSDLYTQREVGTCGEETFGYYCTPGLKNLPTCALSGLEPLTYHILGRQH